MRLDQREIARYLGAAGKPLWPEAAAWARDCQRELEGTVTPRLLGRRLSLSLFAGESRDLDWHLRHCTQGVLFAVTLGAETDRLLRRWSVQSMAKAAVGQAVCAVWLDDLCAAYCAGLLPQLGAGEFLTPPFSPGYGDWSLTAQGRVLDLLQAPKRIGLTLTEGGMLVPEKSITALVGISDRPEEACGQKCMRCNKTDCPFRSAPEGEEERGVVL
ncbi:MAG: hypothetical protein ACLSTT_00685 [Evtepia gabavorous]|uniref:hypothetical protein n=1 Tax=Evtepia gabavorous TaxID=2211183 RepID=UPI003A239B44